MIPNRLYVGRSVAAVSIGVVTSADGSRSRDARSMARNKSVSIGFSSGGLGSSNPVKWTAVSPTVGFAYAAGWMLVSLFSAGAIGRVRARNGVAG